jgi:hypothetical protein
MEWFSCLQMGCCDASLLTIKQHTSWDPASSTNKQQQVSSTLLKFSPCTNSHVARQRNRYLSIMY